VREAEAVVQTVANGNDDEQIKKNIKTVQRRVQKQGRQAFTSAGLLS